VGRFGIGLVSLFQLFRVGQLREEQIDGESRKDAEDDELGP
jgi:hypothetical protein